MLNSCLQTVSKDLNYQDCKKFEYFDTKLNGLGRILQRDEHFAGLAIASNRWLNKKQEFLNLSLILLWLRGLV